MSELRERAEKLIRSNQSEFIDIRLEKRTSLDIYFAVGSNTYPQSQPFMEEGGLIRVFENGNWGIAGFVGIDEIEIALDKAIGLAGSHPSAKHFNLPVIKPATDTFNPFVLEQFSEILLKEKEFICRRYAELLASNVHCSSAVVAYRELKREKIVLNSMGTDITEIENLCGLHLQMGDSPGVSRNFLCRGGFESIRSRENLIEEMIAEFSDTRNSRSIKPGMHRIILHPELTGFLVHSAIGHLSEADTRQILPAFDDILAFGTKIGPEALTLIDDPSYFEMPGSYAWDDEGISGQRTVLIERGKTSGVLHSLHTAGKSATKSTGNGRSVRIASPPSVRMSCTIMMPGNISSDALFRKMGTGLYLKGVLSGRTNFNNFSITCESAWEVKGGVIGKSLKPITITGKLLDIFGLITGIANDKILYGRMTGCFKDRYSDLPISYGGPHILIDKVFAG